MVAGRPNMPGGWVGGNGRRGPVTRPDAFARRPPRRAASRPAREPSMRTPAAPSLLLTLTLTAALGATACTADAPPATAPRAVALDHVAGAATTSTAAARWNQLARVGSNPLSLT